MDRLFHCPQYDDFPMKYQTEILARMKDDIFLAKCYYTEFVFSGYNMEEMQEHLNLTLTNFEHRKRVYIYEASSVNVRIFISINVT